MNELTTEKAMTIKEVAEALGVSYDTVNNCIKRIMPNKLKHGKTTYLNEFEVSEISKELKNNSAVLAHQTVEVTSTVKNTTTEKTMTMQEIADIFKVSKDTIRNCVRRIMPNKMQERKTAYFNESEVSAISKELKSNTFVISHLTEEDSSAVANVTTKLEIIANYKQATDALIAMLNAEKAELQATIETQKTKIAEDAPKVDFYDRVTESSDCIDIGQCAKVLNVHGIGRNKLFEILRQKKILNEHNQPYQKYVDCGYFRIIETSFNLPDGTQKINLKTVVFQKGVDFIRKMIEIFKNTKEKK